MKIQIKKLNKNVKLPEYATDGSAGFDLVAHNFKAWDDDNQNFRIYELDTQTINIYKGQRVLVGTGFSIAIPDGYMMDIRTRSGKALKEGLIVANSPGTIDSDYRGEVGVILINTTDSIIKINKGDKVAQGVVLQYEAILFDEVDDLDGTERGSGGFGHTDLKT